MNALELCAKNHAIAKALAGEQKAAQTAERYQEGWIDRAVAFVKTYCERVGSGSQFMTEDIRHAYTQEGNLTPPDDRAWGHVMRLASARRFVRKVGYAPSASSNNSPKVQWEAM